MFFPNSRYATLGTYTVTRPDNTIVQVTRLPRPGVQAVLGYYRRQSADRLDQVAARFLADPTGFWHICDANGAMVPDALAAGSLIGVPIDAPVGG